jgi:hypothetical protein
MRGKNAMEPPLDQFPPRKLSKKTRNIILGIFWVNMSICPLYSAYENYSPSPLVNEYGVLSMVAAGRGVLRIFRDEMLL